MTNAYEKYDVTGATRPIEAFVEKLSTWYLRRSRRRFWKSESDADKQAAYGTLYTALVTIANCSRPPCRSSPMNFIRTWSVRWINSRLKSVHLSEWPKYDESLIDESLNHDMALMMKLVSLGHQARQKANRKVRQPLKEVAFSLGNASERKAVETFADVIEDELNVKTVRLLDTATEAVSHTVKPLPKQLGQKYGNKFPALQKAILAMNSEEVARALLDGGSVKVDRRWSGL